MIPRFAFILVSSLVLSGSIRSAEPVPGLKDVPTDAMFFIHADVQKLWNSVWSESLRKVSVPALKKDLDLLKETGFDLENIETATLFLSNQRFDPNTPPAGAAILRNRVAFDKSKIEAFQKSLPNGLVYAFLRDEKTCVICTVDLTENLKRGAVVKPRNDSMVPYLELAATKPLMIAGNVGAIPAELRQLFPPELKVFEGLLDAKMAAIQVDPGKTLAVDFIGVGESEGSADSFKTSMEAGRNFVRAAIAQELSSKRKSDEPFMPPLKTFAKSFQALEFSRDKTIVRGKLSIPMDFEVGPPIAAAVSQLQKAAMMAKSSNNLKQICLSFHNFESQYSKLPGAAICDKNGKPLLSWRVSILPYIEQNELYKEFKLDEPWDSANNKQLLAKMPNIYLLPGQDVKSTKTHYRICHGKGAMFDLNIKDAFSIAQIPDGASNTLAAFVAAEPVEWTKPIDIEYDPKSEAKKLFRWEDDLALISFADGSVQKIKKKNTEQTLHWLIQRADGNVWMLEE